MKLRIRLHYLVVFLLLLLPGLYLCRWPLAGRWIQGKIENALGDELGLRARVHHPSGTLLGSLILEKVEGEAAGSGGPLRRLSIERLRFEYNPWKLLRGDLAALRIEADRVEADLDLDRPGLDSSVAEGRAEPSFSPSEELPSIDLARIDLDLRRSGRFFKIEGGAFILEEPDASGEQKGSLSADRVLLGGPGGEQQNASLRLPLSYKKGELLAGPLSEGARDRSLTFRSRWQPGPVSSLEIDLETVLCGGSIRVQARTLLERDYPLEARIEAQGMDALSLQALLEPALALSHPVHGSLGIKGFFEGSLMHPKSLKGSLDLAVENAGYLDLSPFGLNLEGAIYGEEQIQVPGLSLRGAGSVLQISNLSIPLPGGYPALRGAGGRFFFRLEKQGDWVKQTGLREDWAELLEEMEAEGEGRIEQGSLRLEELRINRDPFQARFGELSISEEEEGKLSLAAWSLEGRVGDEKLALEEQLKLLFSSTGIEVESCRLRIGDSGSLSLEGRLSRKFEGRLVLEAGGIDSDLFALFSEPIATWEDLDLTLELEGDLSAPRGTLQAEARSLAVAGERVESAALDLRITPDRLDIQDLAIRLPSGGRCRIQAELPMPRPDARGGPAFDPWSPIVMEAEMTHIDLGIAGMMDGLEGRFSGRLSLKGPLLYPEAVFTGRIESLAWQGIDPHRLTWKSSLEEGILELSEIELAYLGLPVLSGSAALDLNGADRKRLLAPGPDTPVRDLRLKAEEAPLASYARMAGLQMGGACSFELEGGGTLGDPWLLFRAAVDRGWFMPEIEEAEEKTGSNPAAFYEQLSFRLSADRAELRQGALRLDRVRVDLPDGWIEASGEVPIDLAWGRADWEGPLKSGASIAGEAQAFYFALSRLTDLLPGVRKLAGTIAVRARVDGTLKDPLLKAQCTLQEGALGLEGGFPSMERIFAQVEADGEEIRVKGIEGTLGGGLTRLHGTIRLDGFTPDAFDLLIDGEDALLFRDQGLKIRADLDAVLSGTLQAPVLAGILSLKDSRFTRRIPYLPETGPPPVRRQLQPFSLTSPFLRDLRFDLAIRNDPGHGLRVDNNLAEGMVEAELDLKGTGAVPFFQGRVFFNDSLLKLPNFAFHVDTGLITYPMNNPFNPLINMAAHGRRQSHEVDLIVQGPLSDPEIFLSSMPPLDENSLVVLVTTGSLPRTIRRTGVEQEALMQVGSFLGGELIHHVFGSESTESGESVLERFLLETGTEVSEEGMGNIVLEYNFLGGWSMQAERDIYGDANLGFVYRIRFP